MLFTKDVKIHPPGSVNVWSKIARHSAKKLLGCFRLNHPLWSVPASEAQTTQQTGHRFFLVFTGHSTLIWKPFVNSGYCCISKFSFSKGICYCQRSQASWAWGLFYYPWCTSFCIVTAIFFFLNLTRPHISGYVLKRLYLIGFLLNKFQVILWHVLEVFIIFWPAWRIASFDSKGSWGVSSQTSLWY